jgi:hypothetical protein
MFIVKPFLNLELPRQNEIQLYSEYVYFTDNILHNICCLHPQGRSDCGKNAVRLYIQVEKKVLIEIHGRRERRWSLDWATIPYSVSTLKNTI